jgi:hypothetical protein
LHANSSAFPRTKYRLAYALRLQAISTVEEQVARIIIIIIIGLAVFRKTGANENTQKRLGAWTIGNLKISLLRDKLNSWSGRRATRTLIPASGADWRKTCGGSLTRVFRYCSISLRLANRMNS